MKSFIVPFAFPLGQEDPAVSLERCPDQQAFWMSRAVSLPDPFQLPAERRALSSGAILLRLSKVSRRRLIIIFNFYVYIFIFRHVGIRICCQIPVASIPTPWRAWTPCPRSSPTSWTIARAPSSGASSTPGDTGRWARSTSPKLSSYARKKRFLALNTKDTDIFHVYPSSLLLYRTDESKFLCFNRRNLSRIYPKGTRLLSSNFDPLPYWLVGCQMVALNYQAKDRALMFSRAMFRQNARCGYVLKPPAIRGMLWKRLKNVWCDLW